MSILFSILLTIFLPAQFYVLGFFVKPPENKLPVPSVQGASSENKNTAEEKSLKGSLSDTNQNNYDNAGGTGYIPERKNGFYNTKVFAGSSVVIDVDSGTILYYDKGRDRTPIASITKLMTAVVIMEKVKNLDEVVTIDEEASLAEGTKVGCPRTGYCVDERLHVGEKITVKDLLMAMLLDSANDAAIALGKHIAGSQAAFGDLMNEKAEDLNLGDSHFRNPSGLDEDNSYSSAYDMARVAAYSMRYKQIWDIMKMSEIEVQSCDGKYSHQLKNTDLLLGQIQNCLGGKTGFTYNAGKSLLMAAADPNEGKHKIIAVILNDNNRWEDMTNLINWTFENYEWR
jgi:serine-type D-Ala-D-Ala carboxypeptidase (penicillin-binding protein 5/6)